MSVPRGNVLKPQSVEQGFNCQFLSTHHRFQICHNEHKHYSNFRKVITTCPGMRGKRVAARILETIIFSTYYFYPWGGERRIRNPWIGFAVGTLRGASGEQTGFKPFVRTLHGASLQSGGIPGFWYGPFRTGISFSFGANEVRRVEEGGVRVAKHHCLMICRWGNDRKLN